MTEKGRQPPANRASAARLGRRRLLQGLASGGSAAALLAAGDSSATEEPGPDAVAGADHRRVGFHETEHTRWYYRRARW